MAVEVTAYRVDPAILPGEVLMPLTSRDCPVAVEALVGLARRALSLVNLYWIRHFSLRRGYSDGARTPDGSRSLMIKIFEQLIGERRGLIHQGFARIVVLAPTANLFQVVF